MSRTTCVVTVLLMLAPVPLLARQGVESPHGPLPADLDCAACHTASGWSPLRRDPAFDHDRRAGFVLSGAHKRTSCAGCHLGLRFDGPDIAMEDCAGCHADVHEGKMVRDCSDCHTTASFHAVDGEEVHARTSFPLTGAHRQISCESCHTDEVGGAYTSLETECTACHADDYSGARTVDHVANGYPTDCTECHSTLGWSDSPAFDHGAVSGGFELLGAHNGLRCASCHIMPDLDPIFQPAGQDDCVACHAPDYERQHGGSGFPTTCLTCHGVDNWDVENFDHAFTGFPLVERHASLSCGDCHTGDGSGLIFPTPTDQTDCVACHRDDYDRKHRGSGFPTTCLSCHTQRNWDAEGFNHALTAFPLVGAHVGPVCDDCHGPQAVSGGAGGVSAECASCHQAAYDAAHAGSGYPTECLTCHTQDAWAGATFDHAQTAFPLEGAHANAACATCHGGASPLASLPTGPEDCVSCHTAAFDAAHGASSGFPTTCADCHDAVTWAGATADHTALSGGFTLSGPHATALCTACHAVPGYQLLFPKPTSSDDCVACHQAQYDAAHAGSGFPTTCTSCHADDRWTGATLDHPSVSGGFRLLGAHAAAACTSCHAVPGYALLFPHPTDDQDCVACHQDRYDAAHGGSGYPTECADCHTVDAWQPSTFDHERVFLLQSGPHQQKWSACTDCHTSSSDISAFTCFNCHVHSQSSMDEKHKQVNGYVYESGQCLACHPRGLK